MKLALIALSFFVTMSLTACYYKYVVLNDFVIETKPIEDFTEEDLN